MVVIENFGSGNLVIKYTIPLPYQLIRYDSVFLSLFSDFCDTINQ